MFPDCSSDDHKAYRCIITAILDELCVTNSQYRPMSLDRAVFQTPRQQGSILSATKQLQAALKLSSSLNSCPKPVRK